jgi:3-hydroxy-9,10-secoandrosta-1,3,5(10)-triene-9,17-dione monooxygenase reductase component
VGGDIRGIAPRGYDIIARMNEDLRHTIGKVLGRIPSGVFIVTTGKIGSASAMMASWVQQAGFDPPMISMAMAKDRYAANVVREHRHFALNILGENDIGLMKRYARGISPQENPFHGVETRLAASGVPILAEALAFLDCKVVSICDLPGDHDLFIGQVIDGGILREGKSFMHLRGNGFHY